MVTSASIEPMDDAEYVERLKLSSLNVFLPEPVMFPPGFPLKACGNDGYRIQLSTFKLRDALSITAFVDEGFDHVIKRLGLLPVTEMAGLIDDVHFGSRVAVGDDLEERVAAL